MRKGKLIGTLGAAGLVMALQPVTGQAGDGGSTANRQIAAKGDVGISVAEMTCAMQKTRPQVNGDADWQRLLCEMKSEGLVAERARTPVASGPIAQPVTVVIGGGETITVMPAVAAPATLNGKNTTPTSLFGRSR